MINYDEIQQSILVEEKSSKNLKFNGPEYLTATFDERTALHWACMKGEALTIKCFFPFS
jgi:ankyrin repeat protein